MAQRVFFLNRLHAGVDPPEYEDWIRRVDYPVARAQGADSQAGVDGRISSAVDSDGGGIVPHRPTIFWVSSLSPIRSFR